MAVPFTITLTTSVGTMPVLIEDQPTWDRAWAESTRRLDLIGGGPATPDEIDRLAAVIYLDMVEGKESPIWQQLEPTLQEIRDSGVDWFPSLPSLDAIGGALKWGVIGLVAVAAILVLRK